MPRVNHANFPAALKSLKQWVNWKGDKVPRVAGKPISSTDPAAWIDLDSAMAEYVCGGMDGVGFVFTSGIVGIDLDDCLDGDALKPWGLKVLGALPEGAYIEYSPSGRGLHVIVAGHKPGPQCRRELKNKAGQRLGEIEIYDSARYFTMTGHLWNGSTGDLVDGQAAVETLYAKLFPQQINKAPEVSTPAPCKETTHELNADDIISLINQSAQGPKFRGLMSGPLEMALLPYEGDHSRAVHALCAVVAWWSGSPEVMDAIAAKSCLVAGKWAPDPGAHGRAAKGKWAVLGLSGFKKLRGQYLAAGDFYEPGQGRMAPSADFGHTDDSPGPKGGKDGGYQRHIDLALEKGELRRDLLSGALHQLKAGEWEPVFLRSTISALQGDCLVKGKPYKVANVERFLHRFERDSKPQLLLDLPVWDGEDRIGAMCARVAVENVPPEVFCDLFKDWCAKAWQKIFNPQEVRNRCVILTGAQGIGKDIWIESLFCGLGLYTGVLPLDGKFSTERDISVTMGQKIIITIPEFDKTEVLGSNVLKDLITKSGFTQVRKYDREASTTPNRCSIIGSCNPERILRDSTGNRRFLLFKIKGEKGFAIRWDYPIVNRANSLCIIAQMRALGESNYCSSAKSEAAIEAVQREHTPEDVNEEVPIEFLSEIAQRDLNDPLNRHPGIYRMGDLDELFGKLSRNFGLPRNQILSMLRAAGCCKHTRRGNWYGTPDAIKNFSGAELNRPVDILDESFN
jgi:putative DNA primase/helicase